MIIAGALTFLSVASANAQTQPGTSLMDKAWIRMNTELLNGDFSLNDAQKADVLRIDQRFEKKHDEMMAVVPKPTSEEVSKKMEALMKERDSDLRAVLNAEQYEKWEKKRHRGTSELERKDT